VGAKLVLIDTQKDSLEMDYNALEAAITEKTKAIIPIDIAGIPCDYDTLFAIVERKRHLFHPNNDMQKALGRIAIMADTAHAFGAQWHGKMIGSIADFSSFSLLSSSIPVPRRKCTYPLKNANRARLFFRYFQIHL
jgi:dTDP-4-amino-4,6-dideoxygalactose transaminase